MTKTVKFDNDDFEYAVPFGDFKLPLEDNPNQHY